MYRLGHLALLVVDFSKFVVLSFYLFIHIFLYITSREDKGDREGIPLHTLYPWAIRLELFLE